MLLPRVTREQEQWPGAPQAPPSEAKSGAPDGAEDAAGQNTATSALKQEAKQPPVSAARLPPRPGGSVSLRVTLL